MSVNKPEPARNILVLRYVALACAVFYFAWNLFFLIQARIPPSILTGLTGLPSPTTGGTRSLLLLLRGEIYESLRANLFTIPICLCLASTLLLLGRQLVSCERLSIPGWLVGTWGIVLTIAWIAKLFGDRAYW